MKEIVELESEEGMLLDVKDLVDFRLCRTWTSACADTKGAHEIGGFMSPSATKFCRFCLIGRCEINHVYFVDQLVARNRQNYNLAVENSSKDPT